MTPKEVLGLLGERPISFYRCLVEPAGSVAGALMLSQALYWTPRSDDPEGWFFKTGEEWSAETGLSRWEQETARRRLRERGIWLEERRGKHGKLHCRVDLVRLAAALADHLCGNASKSKTPADQCGKTTNHIEGKPQRHVTETTAESTAETTGEREVPHPGPGDPAPARAYQFLSTHFRWFKTATGGLSAKQREQLIAALTELADGGLLPDSDELELALGYARAFSGRAGAVPVGTLITGIHQALRERAERPAR
ncbi:MAG TPA: hypothetical protein VFU47_16355, partial [Armatimonadota bacterium]|nr:hypothetical protein [Armatimonadota bacterium]